MEISAARWPSRKPSWKCLEDSTIATDISLDVRRYGYRSVVTPSDLYHAHPAIWPFSSHFADYHARHARALPRPVYVGNPMPAEINSVLENYLRIHAIFVYNDPRDWGLDLTVLMDLLLSHGGCLGTLSEHNGNTSRPNRGYQQQGQPRVWYSNPDQWWAAEWPLPRIGQGGFRAASGRGMGDHDGRHLRKRSVRQTFTGHLRVRRAHLDEGARVLLR